MQSHYFCVFVKLCAAQDKEVKKIKTVKHVHNIGFNSILLCFVTRRKIQLNGRMKCKSKMQFKRLANDEDNS